MDASGDFVYQVGGEKTRGMPPVVPKKIPIWNLKKFKKHSSDI